MQNFRIGQRNKNKKFKMQLKLGIVQHNPKLFYFYGKFM